MKAAVIVFPGSNCDRDCKVAIERSAGARVDMVWHQETALPDDLDLISYAETAQEVWEIISQFYQINPQPKLPRAQ